MARGGWNSRRRRGRGTGGPRGANISREPQWQSDSKPHFGMNAYPREATILGKRPLEGTSGQGYPRPPSQYFPTNVEPKTQYIEANERAEMQYFQVNEKTDVHNFQANVKDDVGIRVTSEDGTKSDDTTPVESTSQSEQLERVDELPAEKKAKIDESASIHEEEAVVKEGFGSGGRSEDVVSRELRRVSDGCDGEIPGHLLLLSFPTSLPPFPSLSSSPSLPHSPSSSPSLCLSLSLP